jgi:hypothetical protein
MNDTAAPTPDEIRKDIHNKLNVPLHEKFKLPFEESSSTKLYPNVFYLVPPYNQIPEEFKRDNNPWCRWQIKWFFSGLDGKKGQIPDAKKGINRQHAMTHLSWIQQDFQIPHEHKQAAVAYLASLWMEPLTVSLDQ